MTYVEGITKEENGKKKSQFKTLDELQHLKLTSAYV